MRKVDNLVPAFGLTGIGSASVTRTPALPQPASSVLGVCEGLDDLVETFRNRPRKWRYRTFHRQGWPLREPKAQRQQGRGPPSPKRNPAPAGRLQCDRFQWRLCC